MDGFGRCGLLNACTANTAKLKYARITWGKRKFHSGQKELRFGRALVESGIETLVLRGSNNAVDVLAAILASADLP